MNIGMSSRGAFEEKLNVLKNMLHSEIHLVEALNKNPEQAEKITPRIDAARKNRQEYVKHVFGDNINTNQWCNLKHLLISEFSLTEEIENASRIEPDKIPEINERLTEVIEERNHAIGLFSNKNLNENSKNTCHRCSSDLSFSVSDTRNNAKSLNTEKTEIEDIKINGGNTMKANLTEFGLVSVGQVAGYGGSYLADYVEANFTPTNASGYFRTRNLINVVGGVAVGLGLPMLMKGEKNTSVKKALMVAGAAMLVKGLVDVYKDATGTAASTSRVARTTYTASSQPVTTSFSVPQATVAALY